MCIKELNHPARAAPPPPITKLIRNAEETVRYIVCAYSALNNMGPATRGLVSLFSLGEENNILLSAGGQPPHTHTQKAVKFLYSPAAVVKYCSASYVAPTQCSNFYKLICPNLIIKL
jgi:hypothetical protein